MMVIAWLWMLTVEHAQRLLRKVLFKYNAIQTHRFTSRGEVGNVDSFSFRYSYYYLL